MNQISSYTQIAPQPENLEPKHQAQTNLFLTWLARALGFGLLLGMAALWMVSIFKHLN